MGLAKGLKAITEAQDAATAFSGDRVKVTWLALKDGQKVKARFINELDEESPYFLEQNGVALVASEHTNPADFHRKMVCTMEDEGRCVGCEAFARETPEDKKKNENKSWRPKYRFYINVLIDDGMQKPYVAVWSQGLGKQSAFDMLREYYGITQGITNLEWNLSRKGEKTDTVYTLFANPAGPDKEPFDWTGIEAFPLEAAVLQIPYASQEKFLFGVDKSTSAASITNTAWE